MFKQVLWLFFLFKKSPILFNCYLKTKRKDLLVFRIKSTTMFPFLLFFLFLPLHCFCCFCCTKGENNKAGRRSVWPDNVKVFKGGDKEVLLLTCERWGGGPLSVYSDPRPAARHRGRCYCCCCCHSGQAPGWPTYTLCGRTGPMSRCVRRSAETAQSCTRSHSCSQMKDELESKV